MDYETDSRWLLVEEGFVLPREHEVESLFTVGNGATGTRGALEEGSDFSAPATFVAGVFFSSRAAWSRPGTYDLSELGRHEGVGERVYAQHERR